MAGSGTALVTGAARRIGRGIAERLAAAGYDLALHCSPASRGDADAVAATIAVSGRRTVAIPADLADPDAAAVIFEAAAALGPVDLLVNSAAIFEPDDALCPDALDRHLAINLAAPLRLAAAFARALPAGREGAIVNIVDQRVLRPLPGFHSYGISKAALWEATRSLALALAPRGIRVNAVAPGPVLPNRHDGEPGFAREAAMLPLGHPVAVEEIAEAVLYLATARSVTGQIVAVDSGQHLMPPGGLDDASGPGLG